MVHKSRGRRCKKPCTLQTGIRLTFMLVLAMATAQHYSQHTESKPDPMSEQTQMDTAFPDGQQLQADEEHGGRQNNANRNKEGTQDKNDKRLGTGDRERIFRVKRDEIFEMLLETTTPLSNSNILNISKQLINATSPDMHSNFSNEYQNMSEIRRACNPLSNTTLMNDTRASRLAGNDTFPTNTDTQNACETHQGHDETTEQTKAKASTGLLSAADVKHTFKIFRTISIIPLSIALLSTVVSVLALCQQKVAYQVRVLLIAFLIVDGGKSLFFLINRVFRVIEHEVPLTWDSAYPTYFTNIILWLPDSLGRVSLLINSFLVTERFYSIVFPIMSKSSKIPCFKFPKIVVSVVVVCMFLFQTSSIVLFHGEVKSYLNRNQTFTATMILKVIAQTSPTAFYKYQLCQTVAAVLFRYFPLIVALVLNTLTIISLILHHKRHAKRVDNHPETGQSTRQSQRIKQTNIMIVTSSTVYTILVSLKPMVRMVSTFTPGFGHGQKDNNLYILMDEICLFLDCLTPITNFAIYFTLSGEFRKALARIITQTTDIISAAQPEKVT